MKDETLRAHLAAVEAQLAVLMATAKTNQEEITQLVSAYQGLHARFVHIAADAARLRDERDAAIQALGEVLARFSEHNTGEREACVRTGWVHVSRVNAWRRVLAKAGPPTLGHATVRDGLE